MQNKRHSAIRAETVTEFNQHENRADGRSVADSLRAGLTVLRDAFYRRIHEDVERIVGKDSMLAPVSERKSRNLVKTETELYQIAVSAKAVRDFGYVSDGDWYLDWLVRLRLGKLSGNPKANERLAYYAAKSDRVQRLAFTNLLAMIFPESREAPLVLFQLFPLSVQIATALAFGDRDRAAALRQEQVEHLPAICDCRECRGALLENGDQCQLCANPVWKAEFLAAD